MKKTTKMLPMNQMRAMVSESSINEEKRTVDLIWTTGSKGLRSHWGERYYEELSLAPEHVDLSRLNDGSHPLLAAHDSNSLDSVIGVVERAWLEGDKGIATVRFASDEISQRAFTKVKEGVLRNVSVGYSVRKYDPYEVEGEEYPTYRAVDWQPMEISIVPIGFDAAAKIRSEEVTENEVEIISTRSESTNPPIEETPQMTDEQKKQLAQEAAAAERTRVLEIRKAVKEANLPEDMAVEYIERGTSSEEARTNIALFAKYAKEQEATRIESSVRVEVGVEDTQKKRDALTNALLHRVDPQNFKLESGNDFAAYSTLRGLEEAGVVKRDRGMSDISFASRAMSSSELPHILSNVAEKTAQKKYELAQPTHSRWSKTDVLRNFKTADRVRSGDFASLQERQEGGEFKLGVFGEEREQVALKEFGAKMAFTRRMLINDDLGEIQKVMAQAGAAASNLENQLVYAQLTSNPTMGDSEQLFSTAHANKGSTAALTDSSIGEAFKIMRLQKSVDERHYLNLRPKYLICGPLLEVTARKYLASISPTQASNVNVFSNSLELIVDPEISTNDYYFAADQNLIDTVVLYKLQGEERPRVESRVSFDTESFEMKIAHSCVAKVLDWRGLVLNEGGS